MRDPVSDSIWIPHLLSTALSAYRLLPTLRSTLQAAPLSAADLPGPPAARTLFCTATETRVSDPGPRSSTRKAARRRPTPGPRECHQADAPKSRRARGDTPRR